MAKERLIMAWSKCKVSLAPMPETEEMAEDSAFFDVGHIRQNTTSLSANEGDALQAIESGGAILAEEKQEGDFSLATEIIEPSNELYQLLGLGSIEGDDLKVKTHIVPGNFCLKLTPKNIGAKGIKAPKCSVSVTPAFGDDTGHALTLNISILQGDAGYWYSKFKFLGNLKLNKNSVSLANTDTTSAPTETITVTTDAETVTAVAADAWCKATVSQKTVKIGAQANSTQQKRNTTVTISAGGESAVVSVEQAAGAGG